MLFTLCSQVSDTLQVSDTSMIPIFLDNFLLEFHAVVDIQRPRGIGLL